MRILAKIGACFLVAVLSAGAQARPAPTDKNISSSQAAINAFLKALHANRRSPLFSGTTVMCNIGNPCSVALTPQELFDTNGNLVACAIQVGDIKLDTSGHSIFGVRTKIDWTINPPAPHNPPTNATYTFELTTGLIIFKDDANETKKKADSVTATDLVMTHTWKKRNATVIYYPLVFQTIGSNPPTLCGVGDPQIVNN
jgi:hypothetical protein